MIYFRRQNLLFIIYNSTDLDLAFWSSVSFIEWLNDTAALCTCTSSQLTFQYLQIPSHTFVNPLNSNYTCIKFITACQKNADVKQLKHPSFNGDVIALHKQSSLNTRISTWHDTYSSENLLYILPNDASGN